MDIGRGEFKNKHILIIVENLPVPFDQRVWLEAMTLKEQGAQVSIICPQMYEYVSSFEQINGIDIYRHPLPSEGTTVFGYFIEYTIAIFWEIILSFRIFFKNRFHVIHACNPPDLIFVVALLFKPLGVKFVFDHHDINPELYEAKFEKKGIFYQLLLLLERLTFSLADFSIATNESFKKIAVVRGKMKQEKVVIIRNGPNLKRLIPGDGQISYKKGRKYLVGYIGVIGKQDGLDILMEVISYLKGKNIDIHFAIIGNGTELDKIKHMAKTLLIQDRIDFHGRISDNKIINDILNACDLCVNPDKPVQYNDLITTNKVMEYMALKKAIVQFDVMEGKYSAGQASLYALPNDIADFGSKIIYLLDNPEKRRAMGEFGYRRIVDNLSWEHEKLKLINLYKRIFAPN